MASKASRAVRLRQNRGVKPGTIRTGRGGKTTRRYNAQTGRWDVISVRSGQGAGRIAGSGSDGVNAASSTGTAKTSAIRMEGPKRSMARGSSIAAFANNPIGYLAAKSRTSGSPVLSQGLRPSMGTPMQLKKSRSKTSAGRTQYRWVPKR